MKTNIQKSVRVRAKFRATVLLFDMNLSPDRVDQLLCGHGKSWVLFNRTDGAQILGNDQENPRTRYRSRRLQRDCMRTLGSMGEEIVRLKHSLTGALIDHRYGLGEIWKLSNFF
ncbi:hypothetical protein [uncultured Lamprocystis sp.]|jgi:hypothetical protein|uniref:hypothetical protein n=1 Tax=uncultured Lamprocystis sp. TaxID=543132 RepID=UPI0025F2C069|nr:hypothetical protein [uncultured Lamprocystis sp.]